MNNMFLINDVILFSPEDGSLTPRKSWPSGRITLHAPAAECLHLLLNHVREPVPQKQFFAQVWEKKGVVVSTNTLYQSIASVRKALKAAGLEEDIIRTLPKQGFQCNATVQSGSLSDFIPPAPVMTTPAEQEATRSTSPRVSDTTFGWLIGSTLSLLMLATLYYWNQSINPAPTIKYFEAGNIDQCKLYSSWSGSEYSQTVFSELRQRYPINCAKKMFAYLTINRLQIGSTLMLCTAPIRDDMTECKSIIFRDDNDEDN
jgi:DNA-binding winged-HTH domains